MNNYFVVFYAEDERNIPFNDVIEYEQEIKSIQDIRNIEKNIGEKRFGDTREIVLIKYNLMKE